ncbi:MAG: glycosyltransferase [Bryobacteraceae bacterium]
MKILICIRQMVMGGIQVNAIDLAVALRDRHGCEVAFFGAPGPLVQLVKQHGMRFYPSPDALFCPSWGVMKALRAAVRQEQPNLLHAWDWPPSLEAFLGVHLPMGIPMLVTDMLHEVNPIMPKRVPNTFGVPALVDEARARGRQPVGFLPPPVDLVLNAPSAVDTESFLARCHVQPGEIVITTVSRLDPDMKTESIARSLDLVEEFGKQYPIRFIITGDGQSRAELEQRAAVINAGLQRTAVIFTGALLDPRPAYAVADVVIGMGGSAMRSMAFGKPTIVVGMNGFAKLLCPETAESIYYNGNYGSGDGSNDSLRAALGRLLEQPETMVPLGRFSRDFVEKNFGLEAVADRLAAFCQQAAEEPPSFLAASGEALRIAGVYFRYRLFQRSWSPVPSFAVES